MSKPKILIQLDSDPRPSVFDAVVAVDSDVAHLLQYGGVTPENVQGLVHGAMFTRGPQDLAHTAIFIGGSDVQAGERLLEKVASCFFGPLRVSVLLDANGANTTAAAAVHAAARHLPLSGATAAVLGGAGPVGQRSARLLAAAGASVRVCSRSLDRAAAVCGQLKNRLPTASLTPHHTETAHLLSAALEGVQVVIAAGAAGAELLPAEIWQKTSSLRVAIDLNAVPPAGIATIQPHDKAVDRDGRICYGALGVGGTKMKIHKAALRKIFETNSAVLDAEEIFALAKGLE